MNSVSDLFKKVWQAETTELCKIRTYRKDGRAHPDLLQCRAYLNGIVHQFNVTQKVTKMKPFTWAQTGTETTTTPTDEEILASDYWVFGYRFGSRKKNPGYKLAIICHLDTVPAAENTGTWDPYVPVVEEREYPAGTVSPQDFLVGRGTIDDKGPAVSALIVARTIAEKYDNSPLLDDVQIEISFDSSEETDMSTPHYMDDPNTIIPHFGVVYDAAWNTRAEKGIERPFFTIDPPSHAPPEDGIYLHAMTTTPGNSTNTVPDWALLEIRGESAVLERFAGIVENVYNGFDFGDEAYRRARMEVTKRTCDDVGTVDAVLLRAFVSGAQHGSAPDENRSGGANPLVSLSNFAAGMVRNGTLKSWGAPAIMCEFIARTWDTRVFGEAHESLYKYDEVFTEGNGTTYAVTKSKMTGNEDDVCRGIELQVDIRYSVPHHDTKWDPSIRREGFLDGDDSKFGAIFGDILGKFNILNECSVQVETSSKCPPDIRWPDSNASYGRIEKAYREVRGVNPPRYAIGGGTDAKGYTFLLAVGALFSTDMGPPVNYHGISEGAPIKDMEESTKVLYRVMELEINERKKSKPDLREFNFDKRKECLKRIRHLRKRGFSHRCECLA